MSKVGGLVGTEWRVKQPFYLSSTCLCVLSILLPLIGSTPEPPADGLVWHLRQTANHMRVCLGWCLYKMVSSSLMSSTCSVLMSVTVYVENEIQACDWNQCVKRLFEGQLFFVYWLVKWCCCSSAASKSRLHITNKLIQTVGVRLALQHGQEAINLSHEVESAPFSCVSCAGRCVALWPVGTACCLCWWCGCR